MTSVARRAPTRSTRGRRGPAADPVLASKMTAPTLAGWVVARPRVEERVAVGARGTLTSITGPPGAGKTVAIASWAATHRNPVAWVTLDDHDNRPAAFWSYVVAALRRAGVTIPEPAAASAGEDADRHAFLLRLACTLAAQDPPVVLILDDLHLVTNPGTLDGLAYLLRHAGSGFRLVVASRTDPLLPLHRYRLTGELTEIRAKELAFTAAEAERLMAQHGVTLQAEHLETLISRTEGWAAGLRLVALSLNGHPDPSQFVGDFASDGSAVVSYLVEEVLNSQSASARDLLLRTGILNRVNAEIACELADDDQTTGSFPELARANAFVQPLGGGWYRYHTLFADVLRLKLRYECPGVVPDLHRRAAGWYARNGFLHEAVWHAAEAADWQLAATMVVDELAVSQVIDQGDGSSLAARFLGMPADATWIRPEPLLVAAATALSGHRVGPGVTGLGAAERILDHLAADQEVPSRLAAAIVRLAFARRDGDLEVAADAAARAGELLEGVPCGLLARHPETRAQVLAGRGAIELWSGDFGAAAATLDAAVAIASASDSERERADSLGQLALAEALRGHLSRAAELAAGLGHAQAAGAARGPNPSADVAFAWVHLERGELAAVRLCLKQADAALQAGKEKLIGAVACLVAARHNLAEGRVGAAGEMICCARDGWSPPPWLDRWLTLVEARVCAARKDIQAALDAAKRAAGTEASADVTVALAQVWLAAGEPPTARRVLAHALPGPRVARDQVPLEAWLIDARISYDSGDLTRGRQSLRAALQLGEREQLRLPFIMESAWVRSVLRRDPDLARDHPYLYGPTQGTDSRVAAGPRVIAQPVPVVVEPLSEREQEVLRHASGMLSTAEIAMEMFISINTVKSHLKSVYRKLEATRRGEAVRRARQLELL